MGSVKTESGKMKKRCLSWLLVVALAGSNLTYAQAVEKENTVNADATDDASEDSVSSCLDEVTASSESDCLDAETESPEVEYYNDTMEYVEALSEVFASYPCDYDATLTIDVEESVVLDADGEVLSTVDEVLESALEEDSADAVVAVLEEASYSVVEVSEDTIVFEDPYLANRLMVWSEDELADSYGAEEVLYYAGEYVLQYADTESTMYAYEMFCQANLEVYVDSVLTLAEDVELETAALSGTEDGEYLSWGVSVMGLDVMQEGLDDYDTEIVVAVVDSGVNYENAYLADRLVGTGYNVLNTEADAMDDNGHGTHVAGIIADCTCDNVSILSVKVADENGNLTLLDCEAGLLYAYENGADVINMSLASTDATTAKKVNKALENIFQKLEENNIVVVCAAGNSGADISCAAPANSEYTIAVGSLANTEVGLTRLSSTNYGEELDFVAPGGAIVSTYNETTKTLSGTSMASPHVAAAVALLKVWDASLSIDEIKELLIAYSVDLGDEGKDAYYGYGYIYLGDFFGESGESQLEGDVSSEKSQLEADASLEDDQLEDELSIKKSEQEIVLTETSIVLTGLGTTSTIGAKAEGALSFASDNKAVVIVSEDGVLTAVKEGTACITITAAETDDYYEATATVTVTVKKLSQTITASVASSTLVGKGTTAKISASTSGNGTLSYASSNTSVAKVSSSGKITAVGAGTATITVTAGATSKYKKATKTLKITVKLAAPTLSSIANTSSGIKVTWKSVSGASKYAVYRKTKSGSWKQIATTKNTSYTDKTAKAGTLYYYRVRCINSSGSGISAYSSSKKYTRVEKITLSSVKNLSGKKLQVNWKKNSKVTGYQIQYSTSKSFASSKTKQTTVKTKSTVKKIIKSLTKGKTYYVRIRAYKTVDGKKYYGTWSATKTVKIKK